MLCQHDVVPALDAVASKSESRASGVINLVQICLDLLSIAETKAGAAISAPLPPLDLALGNLVACDKIANTVLVGGLTRGESVLCDAILPGELAFQGQ